MKIYVSLPENASTEKYSAFLSAVNELSRLGHVVRYSTEFGDKKDKAKSFSELEKKIKETDIVIAEASNPDIKLGYEIARAIDEKKVVILLKDENSKEIENAVVDGNNWKSVIVEKYKIKELSEKIVKLAKEAQSKLDTKFILILSPEIDRYLDWVGQNRRMHKAQVVRNALEQVIKKDKDYLGYLNNQ